MVKANVKTLNTSKKILNRKALLQMNKRLGETLKLNNLKGAFLIVFLILGIIILLNPAEGDNETSPKANASSSKHLTSLLKIGEVAIGSEVVDVVEDEVTNCQYIYESKVGQNFSLTPYYDEFGNVKGCKSHQ